MKKLLNVFIVIFVMSIIPFLSACSNFKNGRNISYDLCLEFNCLDDGSCGELVKVPDENNYYSIDFEENTVLYIDSHNVNIFNKIYKNTDVILSFYLSPLSTDIEITLNDEVVQYDTKEIGGYQCYEITFNMNESTTVSLIGSLFML